MDNVDVVSNKELLSDKVAIELLPQINKFLIDWRTDTVR
jgi:hypothetical protein